MIERKIFTSTDDAARNCADVSQWLMANAMAYFTGFGGASGYVFRCRIDGINALELCFQDGYSKLTLRNGAAVQSYYNNTRIARAYKTESGLLLIGGSSDPFHLFITKSSAGSTAFIWILRTTSNTYAAFAADFDNSVTINRIGLVQSGYNYVIGELASESDNTSLASVTFSGGSFTESLFLTPQCEYAGEECILTVDGVQYVYDGAFALRDGEGGSAPTGEAYTRTQTDALLAAKVDKLDGKQLSTEDYTTAEKQKLAALENYDDTDLTAALQAEAAAREAADTALQTSIAAIDPYASYASPQFIESGTDLNTLTAPGAYKSTSAAHAASLINTPHTSTGFRLETKWIHTVNYLVQILYPGANTGGKHFYHRNRYNGTWGSWYEYEGTEVSATSAPGSAETAALSRAELTEQEESI